MSTESDPLYQEATTLAEAGEFPAAYDLFQRYLKDHPDDAEALNDAAVVLHCMHRSAEGIDYLVRARQIAGDSPEIVWNLAEAYLVEARAREARPLLQIMAENKTLTADILNRAARIFVDQNELEAATDLLTQSLDLCPDQELLHPIIEIIDSKKPGFIPRKPAASTPAGITPQ